MIDIDHVAFLSMSADITCENDTDDELAWTWDDEENFDWSA